jgi:phosphatidylethanolamine/phosphatidyl-N-methylethanolamine N-methyltransferase
MSMVDNLRFAEAFLRNPTQVGAIAPSSKFLTRQMLADLSLKEDESVIEFGPGTGSFTAGLAEILPDSGQYLGIECDQRMIQALQQRFSQLAFAHGRAEQALELYKQSGLGSVKAIISGLPFAGFGREAQDQIMAAIESFWGPGMQFRTFQYAHAYVLPRAIRFRRRMSERFGQAKCSRIVLRNLPPACVLTWRG